MFEHKGHDAASVRGQELSGSSDANLFMVCRRERRVLVTLDHDFGNILRFPPEGTPGIIILEVPDPMAPAMMIALARTVADELTRRPVADRLWIAQPGRIRERSAWTESGE